MLHTVKALLLLAATTIALAQPEKDRINEALDKMNKAVMKAFPELTKEPSDSEKRAEFNRELARMKKDPKEFSQIIMALQVQLAKMGYGTTFTGDLDERTKNAVREYQRFSGLKATGEIDYDTWTKMGIDFVGNPPPILPALSVVLDLWDTGYVLASGTWVSKDPEQEVAPPLQTSSIKCVKEIGICTEAIAYYLDAAASGSLYLDQDTYLIERWDDYEIVTKPIEAQCARNVLRVNRAQKTLTSLRSTISSVGECANTNKSDWLSELGSGVDVYMKQQRKLSEANRRITRMGASAVRSETQPGPKP